LLHHRRARRAIDEEGDGVTGEAGRWRALLGDIDSVAAAGDDGAAFRRADAGNDPVPRRRGDAFKRPAVVRAGITGAQTSMTPVVGAAVPRAGGRLRSLCPWRRRSLWRLRRCRSPGPERGGPECRWGSSVATGRLGSPQRLWAPGHRRSQFIVVVIQLVEVGGERTVVPVGVASASQSVVPESSSVPGPQDSRSGRRRCRCPHQAGDADSGRRHGSERTDRCRGFSMPSPSLSRAPRDQLRKR
jgi:hypothetical protein